MDSSVDLAANYNDNITLTTAPHPTVWGVSLSPAIRFSGETETLKASGGLRVGFVRYYGEEGLNHNDLYFTSQSSYKAERDVLGLNLAAISDPTLITELATTGVVTAYRQRRQLTANPSWRRSLTEATALTASYSYTAVNYDTSGTSLTDYRTQAASVGLQSALNDRSIGSVTGYYSKYDTEPATAQATDYGVAAGLDYAFSETVRGSFVVGGRKTRSSTTSEAFVCDGPIISGFCFGNVTAVTLVNNQSSTGYTLDAGLEKRWETATLGGRLSRQIYPTGNAQLVQTDRLQVAWTYQWSPTVTASITGSVYQVHYLGGVPGGNNRYYQIEPTVSWHVTESWLVSARYGYSRVKYEGNPAAAAANVLSLTLNYAWPKISVSR